MRNIAILIFGFWILSFIGCATSPITGPGATQAIPGVYHRVEKGQTLWRISKMYNIDLEELVGINHIAAVTNIEVGKLIFIPRQKKQIEKKDILLEDFIWPIKGRVINSFGQKLSNVVNKGINIEPSGNSDVVASRSGRIIFYSPDFKGYGKTIIIDHQDGFTTVYSRNTEVFIKPGDKVLKGMVIARVNNYLHFEIRKGYVSQNPNFYLQ
ncbi:MAG: LysM peptidoglycan-binding domain-containing M23 family metallopeptidase [Candidatus Omnitrophota bacterium]